MERMMNERKIYLWQSEAFRQVIAAGAFFLLGYLKLSETINWPWYIIFSPLGVWFLVELIIETVRNRKNETVK